MAADWQHAMFFIARTLTPILLKNGYLKMNQATIIINTIKDILPTENKKLTAGGKHKTKVKPDKAPAEKHWQDKA